MASPISRMGTSVRIAGGEVWAASRTVAFALQRCITQCGG